VKIAIENNCCVGGGSSRGGSGRVAVIRMSLGRGYQGGSNGVKMVVNGSVLREIGLIEKNVKKKMKK
jgi:hypothetical protein